MANTNPLALPKDGALTYGEELDPTQGLTAHRPARIPIFDNRIMRPGDTARFNLTSPFLMDMNNSYLQLRIRSREDTGGPVEAMLEQGVIGLIEQIDITNPDGSPLRTILEQPIIESLLAKWTKSEQQQRNWSQQFEQVDAIRPSGTTLVQGNDFRRKAMVPAIGAPGPWVNIVMSLGRLFRVVNLFPGYDFTNILVSMRFGSNQRGISTDGVGAVAPGEFEIDGATAFLVLQEYSLSQQPGAITPAGAAEPSLHQFAKSAFLEDPTSFSMDSLRILRSQQERPFGANSQLTFTIDPAVGQLQAIVILTRLRADITSATANSYLNWKRPANLRRYWAQIGGDQVPRTPIDAIDGGDDSRALAQLYLVSNFLRTRTWDSNMDAPLFGMMSALAGDPRGAYLWAVALMVGSGQDAGALPVVAGGTNLKFVMEFLDPGNSVDEAHDIILIGSSTISAAGNGWTESR